MGKIERRTMFRIIVATVLGIVAYFIFIIVVGFILPTQRWNKVFFDYIILKLLAVIGIVYLYLLSKQESLPNYDNLHTEKTGGFKETDHTFVFKSKEGKIKLGNPFRGILILGGAGSGKTKSLIEPIIYQATAKGFAGIVYDFKTPDAEERERMQSSGSHSPTLAEIVRHAHSVQNSSVRQYFVNFVDVHRSHRCNPLQVAYLRNPTYARQYAETVLKNTGSRGDKDNYFLDVAINLFSGVIWYLRNNAPQYCTLPHAVAMVVYCDLKQVLEKISEDIEVESMVSSVVDAMGSDRTIANITSTLKNGLSKINSKEIAWVLSGNDFDLDINNPADPKFVVIGNNPQVQDALSPVISLLISSALTQMNSQGKQPSIVLLDEAPTLYLPNFDNTPATARSNRIVSVYAAQDISQMQDMYGQTAAQKIVSNLGCQFFGQTNNVSTVKNTIELFGRIDTVKVSNSRSTSTNSQSGSDNRSEGRSKTTETRDILKASDITNLKRGEFLAKLVDSNYRSIKTQFSYNDYGAPEPLPILNDVNDQSLLANLQQIRSDVKSLVSSTQGNGTSDDFERF